MTNISVAIVGHPDRQNLIDPLSRAVQPDAVVMDVNGIGCGANHLRAMSQAYGHAVEHFKDWIVVLEDDAIPVPNFRAQAESALRCAPTRLVSFYLGINHPFQYQYGFSRAVKEPVCWIMHPYMRHAVAYAIGTQYVPSLREHIAPLIETNWAPDDSISQYAKETKHLVSYTNPSIVDHLDQPSVIQHRTHLGIPVTAQPLARKAHRFGVPETWNGSYTTVEVR